jgi:hypothetical protein
MDAPILIGAWAAAGSAIAMTVAAAEAAATVFQDTFVMVNLPLDFEADGGTSSNWRVF